MPIEVDSICGDLDEILLRALAQWKAQLENPESCTDQQSLYCLYPKLVSQISWARGTLAQVEGTLQALRLRERMGAAVVVSAFASCCCPCCGGATGAIVPHREIDSCSCRRDPGRSGERHRFRDADEADRERSETRIFEETIIEESRNDRSHHSGRSGRDW